MNLLSYVPVLIEHSHILLCCSLQVHRPRLIPCILCGSKLFGDVSGMVQHVESGSCRGCRGPAQARAQILLFTTRHPRLLQLPQPAHTRQALARSRVVGGNPSRAAPSCCEGSTPSFQAKRPWAERGHRVRQPCHRPTWRALVTQSAGSSWPTGSAVGPGPDRGGSLSPRRARPDLSIRWQAQMGRAWPPRPGLEISPYSRRILQFTIVPGMPLQPARHVAPAP